MSTSLTAYPQKKINRRVGIQIRAWWRTYVRSTREWVDSPSSFFITSYVSLVFALLFAWQVFAATAHFWSNVFNLIFTGWMGLLLGVLSLSQIKWVNRAIGLPVVGVFLVAASAYIYGDARIQTFQILNSYFPFSASQLTNATDYGNHVIFAIDVAAFAMFSLFVWYALFMAQSVMADRRSRKVGRGPFLIASAGALVSIFCIGSLSFAASNSVGVKVLVVRAAYEMDFTSSFSCDKVVPGSRVLLSKMSDGIGYAVNLSFPDRPLFRVKAADPELKNSMPNSSPSYRVVTCNRPVS